MHEVAWERPAHHHAVAPKFAAQDACTSDRQNRIRINCSVLQVTDSNCCMIACYLALQPTPTMQCACRLPQTPGQCHTGPAKKRLRAPGQCHAGPARKHDAMGVY